MSILALPHAAPRVLLFDWHGTLVDTHDAVYCAIDDVLPRLAELGLMDRVTGVENCKTLEDAKLVKYVLDHRRLHPKVKAERKVARTDIFEMLFGPDEDAKHIAHVEFHEAYRNHGGHVTPLETGFASLLAQLQSFGLILGVLTNRDREFMEQEMRAVGEHGWNRFFATVVCGDDVARRKPAPDSILKALENVGFVPGPNTWYVGDSTADAVAAKSAGVTSIFYNGAGWDRHWLARIFPGTVRHPYQPDAVVDNSVELLGLVTRFLHL
jgi:phosphoglycolate phosphatase